MSERLTPALVNKFSSFIFDMDGTLINSEPLHFKAMIKTLEVVQEKPLISLEQLADQSLGKSDEDVLKELYPNWDDSQVQSFIRDKNSAFLEVLKESSDQEMQKLLTPGALDYLTQLQRDKKNCFLITASERDIVGPLLRRAGLWNFFTEVRSRNDSFRTKPSSSPYFDLMRKYQLMSHEVIIFEDSPTGLQAARETGAHVIQITAHLPDALQSYSKDLQQADNFLWLLKLKI